MPAHIWLLERIKLWIQLPCAKQCVIGLVDVLFQLESQDP